MDAMEQGETEKSLALIKDLQKQQQTIIDYKKYITESIAPKVTGFKLPEE
jgi:hypothetical protein